MENIYQKINKVMQEVSYLAKDDKVSTGGTGSYKAISEEKVTSTVRASLIKNGIVIVPIKQEHKREDEEVIDKYGNKKINRLTTVDVTYKIQNIEDKEDYIEAVSSGTGVDTQDKGIGKAMTYAYKYLLLRTFAIPTGEDTDKISSELYTEKLLGTKKEEGHIENMLDKVTDVEAKSIYALMMRKGLNVVDVLKKHYKVENTSNLNKMQYMDILKKCNAMPDKNKEIK